MINQIIIENSVGNISSTLVWSVTLFTFVVRMGHLIIDAVHLNDLDYTQLEPFFQAAG